MPGRKGIRKEEVLGLELRKGQRRGVVDPYKVCGAEPETTRKTGSRERRVGTNRYRINKPSGQRSTVGGLG